MILRPVGVGHDEHPPTVHKDLDPVREFDAITEVALHHRPHHAPLHVPRAELHLRYVRDSWDSRAQRPDPAARVGEQLGSRFVPTKITPGAVLRAAQHADTVMASDGGGGYCWPDFAVSFDAIYTTVRVLEMLAQHHTGLATLRTRIPHVSHQAAVEFCPWDVKGRVMRAMMERHLRDRVDLTDGVKVFFEQGWVLVVPDADRPEYHVIASTLDGARSRALVDEYSALVRSVVAEMAPQAEAVVET